MCKSRTWRFWTRNQEKTKIRKHYHRLKIQTGWARASWRVSRTTWADMLLVLQAPRMFSQPLSLILMQKEGHHHWMEEIKRKVLGLHKHHCSQNSTDLQMLIRDRRLHSSLSEQWQAPRGISAAQTSTLLLMGQKEAQVLAPREVAGLLQAKVPGMPHRHQVHINSKDRIKITIRV